MGGPRKTVVLAVVGAAWVALDFGVAAAELPGPEKARRFLTTFVQAFQTCGTANDQTTGAIMLPSCHPAVPVDSGCSFGPEGKGTGRALTVVNDLNEEDIRITGRLVGLSSGCEGETLCVSATLVVSTVGCNSGDPDGCTMQTLTDFAIGSPPSNGCGVVQGGKVALRTTVNQAFNASVLNSRTSIGVRGVGIRRISSVNSPAPSASTFESGLLSTP